MTSRLGAPTSAYMAVPSDRLPLIALRNTLILPGLSQAIKVGRDRSRRALKEAEKKSYWVIAVQQKAETSSSEDFEPQDLFTTGTLCRIDSLRGQEENGFHVVLRGLSRIQLSDLRLETGGFISAQASEIFDQEEDLNSETKLALLNTVKDFALSILKLVPTNTQNLMEIIQEADDLSYLTHICGTHLDLSLEKKQELLETASVKERSLKLLHWMKDFKAGLEIQNEIRSKLNQKIGKTQRQHILREHIKTLKQELDESDLGEDEELPEEKFKNLGLPEESLKQVLKDLKKYKDMGSQSPESHILRNYLDFVLHLPWTKSTPLPDLSLSEAKKVLDEDHWGLEKVKTRILDQLAVNIRKGSHKKGSILLLFGPPGVGKTSLAKSIAKALGRDFCRMSLGGLRDDSELRGHRRTYVGALPGRLLNSLKKVSTKNPVFLLDEIDKMSRSFHGDPASTLLEILDPEQNSQFVDHYLEIPFDLSEVFFIATANSLEGIPGPLLDRLEVIELSGYTSTEKLHILRKHLMPEALENTGMDSYFSTDQIEVADSTLLELITSYTREAGVRDLKRKLEKLFRSLGRELMLKAESEPVSKSNASSIRILPEDLETHLGPPPFFNEAIESRNIPGLAWGLSWSPMGGQILPIEVTEMPGKGQLVLTGQLGDVMKESASIAHSLLRSHALEWNLPGDLSQKDLHVHVPAGAIPKDGPSAGVTLLTALVSLLAKKPVRSLVAMTGEVTLRGQVLPVGGIKEKLIAAHRAGMKEVLIPQKNKRDLVEIPSEVLKDLTIHTVSHIREVLELSLGLFSSHGLSVHLDSDLFTHQKTTGL